MVKIYCACPMKYIGVYQEFKLFLIEFYSQLFRKIDMRIPEFIDKTNQNAFVFNDLYHIETSDILICHIPEPSVGSCAELGYFRAYHKTKPIIAYKCMDHPWIDKLANFKVDTFEDLASILKEIVIGTS